MYDFSERGGILSRPALETRCAVFVREVGKRDGFSLELGKTYGGRKYKRIKE